jgi:hypothetical protein
MDRQSLSQKYMVHTSLSILTILNTQTTSSRHPNIIQLTAEKSRQHMLQKVQSDLTQGYVASIILKTCVP